MGEKKIFIRVERNCARRETADGTFVYGMGRAEAESALAPGAKASREKGVNS